jgi:hypothetical protein
MLGIMTDMIITTITIIMTAAVGADSRDRIQRVEEFIWQQNSVPERR